MEQKIQAIAVFIAIVGLALSLNFYIDLNDTKAQLADVTQARDLANQQIAEHAKQAAQVEAKKQEKQDKEQAKHTALEADIGAYEQHLDIAEQAPEQVASMRLSWNAVMNSADNQQLDLELLEQTHDNVLFQVDVLREQVELAHDFITVNEVRLREADINTKQHLFNLEASLLHLKNIPTDVESDLDTRGLEVF